MHDLDGWETKQADATPQTSEAEYRLVVENANEAIMVAQDGRLRFVNPKTTEITGFSRKELTSRPFADFIHPDDREMVGERHLRRLRGEHLPGVYPFRLVHKDGSIKWLELNAVLISWGGRPATLNFVSDITEHKRAEEALRQSEGKYRILVEDINEGYTVVQGNRIVFANRRCSKLYGCGLDDLIGHPFTQFVAPEAREYDLEILQKTLRGEPAPERYQSVALRGDGTRFPVEIGLRAITYEGRPAYSVVIRDITERKQAEESLRQSEQRYRLLADNVGDAIWTVDLNMRQTYMSPSITRLLGYSVEEAMARSMREAFTPGSFGLAMRVLREEMALERTGRATPDRTRTLELELNRKDGSVVPVEVKFRFIRDASGRPAEIVAAVRDVSERKTAEKLLRQSEENYRSIFENTGTAMAIIGEDDTIVLANSEFEKLSGLSREKIEGRKHWKEFAAPEDLDRLLEYSRTRKANSAAAPRRYQARLVNSKGEVRHVLVTADLVPGTKRTVVSLLDISEWKEMNARLERSNEESRGLYRHLQSVREEEKKSIARDIHDELGQVLTALKMDVAWLRQIAPEDMKPVIDKAKEMSDSIDGILRAVKRISAELRPQMLDDLGLTAAIEWQVREFDKRTGIKCELKLASEDAETDKEVATAIFRILQEALTNVARHAGATKVGVSLRRKDGGLILRVRDNGKGIREEQLSSPRSFGLIGVRERASSHGGEAEIVGTPGIGTVVTVRIPAARTGEAS